MPYFYNKTNFRPKRPVRSFRDLEVYQRPMECSVIIAKELQPILAKQKFPFLENMINCSMSIPLFIAESHSLRFSDFNSAIATLEKAMLSCNKMIVYLEQSLGIYGEKMPLDLVEDLMRRYIEVRGKMFRLEKSWQKFKQAYPTRDPVPKAKY
ncbi:hypothetical protein L6250_03205 [Candidatus Parcubacteria bacterium]|nr:hypothetical protein [Patescibacteria group bacterium]MBU4466643.1 hypothetical protein [Patescibacteria group bacterium]MCG2688615.1 hypothetical protein [Candidatus Parcubacteria bacterium]